MKTTVSELPASRVRVEVGVEADDVDRRLERAALQIGRELRIPGFRKGKVPAPIVIQRLGRAAVLEQALREAMPEWYERAVLEAGIAPVGDPKLDVSALPEAEGEPLSFSIEVAVRPRAKLGEYRGVEVGRAEPEVPPEAIQAELDRLREGFASLHPVDREAGEGDFLLVDYSGTVEGEPFEGGEGRDELIELGSGRLVDGFEQGLQRARAGEEREVEVTFPEDYRAEDLRGRSASFRITVKEVREKQLPELDDEFAADASEFETLAELRSEIESKLGEVAGRRAEEQFREAAVDAAAGTAEVEIPDEVASARAEEMVDRFLHRLSHQGVDPDAFARVQGGGREGMVEQVKEDAERALRREAVLTAIADAEGIEVSDEDLLEALRGEDGSAEAEKEARKALDGLRRSGRDSIVRADLRMRRAADLVVEQAKPIPLERAEARERLWTPEKEREERGALWTPGGDR